MQIRTIINPKFEWYRPYAEQLPEKFSTGELIYSDRNEIRRFNINGSAVVVKRFGRVNIIKKIIYTFFRDNKAIRSYRNSEELLRRDVETPLPVAYVETRRYGLLDQLYYVSTEVEGRSVKSEFIDKTDFDHARFNAYILFVSSLHEKGILHRDLNPTNVLFYTIGNDDIHFVLIDVNRMNFYDTPVPKEECMENLTLFWNLTPVYFYMLKIYGKDNDWTPEDMETAIRVKKEHDFKWARKKAFSHLFKKKKKQK